MDSAPGQNNRYNRYISAIFEAALRVTAELIEMAQYCTISDYSAITRHRLGGRGRNRTFVPHHRYVGQHGKPIHSLRSAAWGARALHNGQNFGPCHRSLGPWPK